MRKKALKLVIVSMAVVSLAGCGNKTSDVTESNAIVSDSSTEIIEQESIEKESGVNVNSGDSCEVPNENEVVDIEDQPMNFEDVENVKINEKEIDYLSFKPSTSYETYPVYYGVLTSVSSRANGGYEFEADVCEGHVKGFVTQDTLITGVSDTDFKVGDFVQIGTSKLKGDEFETVLTFGAFPEDLVRVRKTEQAAMEYALPEEVANGSKKTYFGRVKAILLNGQLCVTTNTGDKILEYVNTTEINNREIIPGDFIKFNGAVKEKDEHGRDVLTGITEVTAIDEMTTQVITGKYSEYMYEFDKEYMDELNAPENNQVVSKSPMTIYDEDGTGVQISNGETEEVYEVVPGEIVQGEPLDVETFVDGSNPDGVFSGPTPESETASIESESESGSESEATGN